MKKTLEWIEAGLNLEKQGMKFYSNAAKKVNDINSKQLLEFLADEEKKHIKIFTLIRDGIKNYSKINLNKELDNLMKRKIELPAFSKKSYKEITKNVASFNIFYTAIQAEEQAIKFYKDLAKKETDKKLKSCLNRLVKEEEKHKKLIESHKDTLYSYSYWEGMDHVALNT